MYFYTFGLFSNSILNFTLLSFEHGLNFIVWYDILFLMDSFRPKNNMTFMTCGVAVSVLLPLTCISDTIQQTCWFKPLADLE